MTPQFIIQVFRDALMMTFWVCLPVLLVGFIAGICISIVQILTSMQDSAVSTVPRLAAFLAALLVFLPWMLMRLSAYAAGIFSDFSRYAK